MKTLVIAMLWNVSQGACPIAISDSGFVGPEVYTIYTIYTINKIKL